MRRLIAGLVFVAACASGAAGAAARPLVAIVADADGTEITDLLTPFAILAESGAVDVKVVAASKQPVRLMPGVAWVQPQATFAELGRADVIIVPALHQDDDPELLAWLRAQAKAGVRIMSICNGALVLANAGLLDGRQATAHWWSLPKAEKTYRAVTWRRDVRWVTDGQITTTAGISASSPASLNLLRELAGADVMRATAARLDLPAPDPRHNGQDYRLTFKGATRVILNQAAFWNRQDVSVPLSNGFDEMAFGTVLDGWSRTYRSEAWASGPSSATSRHGLVVYRHKAPPGAFDRVANLPERRPMETMFGQIQMAYGATTARFVALQFEHPWGAVTAW
ncbi:MAG: thiamine biosynthesis protein ThiJ [Phenylobacterium zucineum]|nr:MAG: thiamine biosynthesis protein ThiJ [Phenylobacterium zucineum]